MTAFKHRAVLQTDDNEGSKDAFGHPKQPDWLKEPVRVPCFAWSTQKRHVADGDKIVVVEDVRAKFSVNASISIGQRILKIEKKNQTLLIDGPLKIETIQHKHNHIEAALSKST